jgi:hypothetical protein
MKKIILLSFLFLSLNTSIVYSQPQIEWAKRYSYASDSCQKESTNDAVKLNLTSNKEIYLESELIWFELEAIFNENIKLDYKPNFHEGASLRLILVNSNHDTVRYRGGYGEYLGNKNYSDTMNYFDNLLELFGEFEKLPGELKYSEIYRYIPEGNYTFSILVRLSEDGKPLIFETNAINISVIKPSGTALNEYNDLLQLEAMTTERYFERGAEYLKYFENFSREYPESPYLEKIFYHIELSLGGCIPLSERENFYKNFILSNPGFYSNYISLIRIREYGYKNNKTEYINYLQKMSEEKEGFFISKLCKTKINQILNSNSK